MTSLAVKFAVIRELENRVKDLKTELAAEFLHTLDAGDTKAANLDDGTRLGKVSKVDGRVSVVVSDEKAFVEWVRENHPSELVESVRESFKTRLLDEAKKTGVLLPGMDVRGGNPYIRFTSEKGAGEVIAARWPELVSDLLQIEGA